MISFLSKDFNELEDTVKPQHDRMPPFFADALFIYGANL